MMGFVIYPEMIERVVLGESGDDKYTCEDGCVVPRGCVIQEDRRTIYFSCVKGEKGKDCPILKEFLMIESAVGIKKKKGDESVLLSDLVDAIQDSDINELTIPFSYAEGSVFSSENLEKFFSAFLGYETELNNVSDRSFEISIRKGEKEKKPLELIKEKIMEQFFGR